MRHTLIILLLFFSFAAPGQLNMFLRSSAAVEVESLLDFYPGAAAAYSLRNLAASWAGQPVVRVRRSSDNTELDVTAEEVTDGTLTAFVGAGNGLVTIWYDQSGNTNNAVQATTTKQPTLVSSGSVVMEGSLPAISFDGTTDYFALTTGTYTQPLTQISVARLSSLATSTNYGVILSSATEGNRVQMVNFDNASNIFVAFAGAVLSSYAADTNRHLWFGLANTTSSTVHQDGVLKLSGNAGSYTLSGTQLGGQLNGAQVWQGRIQEVVLYPNNQATNQVGIEANINDYYGIY